MADLGNLQFSVSLKDMTDADIKKIKDKLEKAGFKINASADRKSLEKNINDILRNRTFKINVEPNKKIKKAAIEVNKSLLVNSVTSALKGKTFKANVDVVVKTASVQDAIKQAFAKAGMNYNTTASDVRAQRILEIQQRMALRAAQANNNLNRSYREASIGASQFARATVGLNNGLQSNIRFGGKLGTVLGNLASILNSTNILKDVIRIGGELENQRIALGAILQDGGKATDMFSKIQSLAVKSPFGIMDLNQYVKQLSAYQVPYNELYETMKRLADISAGVGVDMGRIILAFGQVKAAGFLKGTELRQFTEANIPMVKALADRFTDLRGEIVSAAEVYDMISKKQITFEDVKSVLWDLTDEGGMFNNMQEVLSESLASKWKNLADAVDVMFGKIADGGIGSALKGVAESLTELTKSWQYVANAIGTATVMFLAHKAAVVLGSKQIASANALYQNTLENKRVEANNLRIARTYRVLTKAEQNLIVTTNKLTVADLKQLIRSNELNKTKALQLIATKKLDSACIRYLQRLYGITDAQIRTARSSTWLKRMWIQLGNGARALGVALKGLFLNPWFLATTAITGLVEVFTYFSKKSEESEQRIKDSLQVATEGYRNLSDAVKESEGTPNTDAGLISGIERMTASLKDYAANSGKILSEIYKKDDSGDYVYDLEKRYELLKEKLLQTKNAYELLTKSMNGFSESANDATDGVWDDSLIVNLQDLSKSSSEYNKYLNEMTRNAIQYEEAVAAAAKEDEEFAKAIKGKNFREQIALLKDYEKATDTFREYLYANEHATVFGRFNLFEASFIDFKNDLSTAEEDIQKFAETYKNLLKGSGFDLNNLSEEQKIAIGVDLTGFIDKIEGLDEETKKLFYQRVLEKEFNINVTAKFSQGVNEERWRLELIKAAGGEDLEKEVEVMIKAASDYESVVEEVRKMYKDANEVVEDLNPVLLKANVQFNPGEEVDEDNMIFWGLDKETQKAVKEWNKAVKQIKAAQNIANDQGFLLTEVKKSSKDPIAELWKDRIAAIEKAVKMYDQWKQIEGRDNADARVRGREEFSDLFSGEYGFKLDLEKPTAVYEYIQSLLDENKEKQKELIVSLGVKISDADLNDAKNELNNLLDVLKRELDKKTSQWNLYKDLLKATGNKRLSMNIAFGGNIGFDTELDWLKSEIEKKLGDAFNFDDIIAMSSDQLKEKGLANIVPLVEKYNEATKKLSQESIKNFIDILNASKDFQQKIADIERNLQKDLADLRANYIGISDEALQRKENQLIKNAEEEKTKIRFEEFKESSDWVKVFDDLDRVSDATLDNMISKIEEFAKQAHLSEEVTKQLVEAMAKLRDEAIERNPFEGFKDAWNRLKYLKSGVLTESGMVRFGSGTQQDPYTFKNNKDVNNEIAEANDDLKDSALAVADKFQAVANAADLLGGLFENLGIDLGGLKDVLGGTASGAQTGAGIASAFGLAGPWGAIAGAAVGMLSSVFAMHDKSLQKEIEASEARVKAIKNIAEHLESILERTMGGVYSIALNNKERNKLNEIVNKLDSRNLRSYLDGNKFYSDKTRKKAQDAIRENSYYDAQLALLMAEREEVQEQMRLEDEKKKTNKDKIEDYKKELDELDMSIKYFAEDMANALYGIDFKDWASQLSEALVNAWANGEDAVLAYRDTVTSILKDLGVSVLAQKVIEPLLNETMDKFIKQFSVDNGKITDASMDILKEMYEGAEYAAEMTEAYLEGLKKMGIDVSEESKGDNTLSKGIQSVTEDTANLLGSYLNSIRHEVSVKRSIIEKLAGEDIPKMSLIAQAQLTQLNNIASNTLRNAEAADRIYDLFNRVVDKGGNKLKI